MKAEINLENKVRFIISQSWGEWIDLTRENHTTCIVVNETHVGKLVRLINEGYSLVRRLLSSISDEDAIEVAKIIFKNPHFHTDDRGKRYISQMILLDHEYHQSFFSFIKVSAVIDFLRSRGYLVPWMGLSLEEIIEAGWAKYKED